MKIKVEVSGEAYGPLGATPRRASVRIETDPREENGASADIAGSVAGNILSHLAVIVQEVETGEFEAEDANEEVSP